uniref:NADH-ubiquinone oxidoreductase chain 2 n=2 Tax=Curculionoidea TaxID=71529 RepID=A0A343A628_9CUCU|nr:NADH dehydrogenase subunit 2 [Scolytinae sp. BMNH 1040265]AOY40267.1 NADH dehydrogenase subunit 2 [Curculionoidea sp. 2 KM-2015]
MMFSGSLVVGTLISISATSWLMSWIGLEMNLLSLMPLMKNFKNKYSSEATLKYFMAQAMASSVLVFSIVFMLNIKDSSIFSIPDYSSYMINLSLLMKMGAAPLHFWLPEVVSGVSWDMNMIILTWQKIAPMILVFYSMNSITFLSPFIIISSAVGSLGGLNQTCLRKFMVYSSINHVGWMISAIYSSLYTWLLYFSIYSIINISIIYLLNNNKIFFINQMDKLSSKKPVNFFFMMNFLSLGGLPPFLGFFSKWITILQLTTLKLFSLTTMLIFFTLIALYFYSRITFSSLILNSSESLNFLFNKPTFWMSYFNFINLMMMPLAMSMNFFL